MQDYNHIPVTTDITAESDVVNEPVTLAEMKNYLRLEGFIDDNDSTDIDEFTDDDNLILDMITMSRQSLEEMLGVSIVTHSWEATVTNLAGMVQLRYGPVTSITSLVDSEGDAYDITDEDIVKLIGDYLKCPNDCDMVVQYEAGYTTVPKAIKIEIMRMVAYQYENRGDIVDVEGYKYSDSVMKYSRNQPLL